MSPKQCIVCIKKCKSYLKPYSGYLFYCFKTHLAHVYIDRKCLVSACLNPPTILNGYFEEKPPFQENDVITYKCTTNYALYGRNENVCSGPPSYNWTLAKSDLPSCLKGKNFVGYFDSNQLSISLIIL